MNKRWIGNLLALSLALLAGLATVWVSEKYLKDPDGLLDWTVLALSAVTVGTLVFFVVWGHFQDEPGTGIKEGN